MPPGLIGPSGLPDGPSHRNVLRRFCSVEISGLRFEGRVAERLSQTTRTAESLLLSHNLPQTAKANVIFRGGK